MFRTDLSLADLEEPLTSVLAYWRARGGETLGCAWTSFHLHELPPKALPTTMVLDMFDDMALNRYRFWGSQMTEIHGTDMTGKSPYNLTPKDFAEDLRGQHQRIRAEGRAGAQLVGFRHERGFDHMHTVLRLPLSNDGNRVDHLVMVAWFTPKALEIARVEGGRAIMER